jgi:hypothetical protein
MRTITPPNPPAVIRNAPRVKRSTTAVIAQYIQDLASPAEPAGCPA